MKDVRFYLEFPDKKTKSHSGKEHKRHSGAVFALFLNDGYHAQPEGIAGVFAQPNPPVASTGASWNYLRIFCKRVNEKTARKIHPRLFKVLDHDQ